MRIIAIFFLTVFLMAGSANAALIAQDDGVVFDDVNNQYWIQDLGLFDVQTYDTQKETIAGLSSDPAFSGYGDWHMATAADIANLYTYDVLDIYEAFLPESTPSRGQYGSAETYHGRYDEIDGSGNISKTYIYIELDPDGELTGFTSMYLTSGSDGAYGNVAAWAVVDAASVPVPAAIWLLGSGLLGLVGIRRNKMN